MNAKYVYVEPLSEFTENIFQESQDAAMEVELPSVVACTEGFSTNKLVQFNIEDIDSEDVDDPQVLFLVFTQPTYLCFVLYVLYLSYGRCSILNS